MLGSAPIEESGRRLPQWMLGRSAASEVRKSDDVNENKKQLEEGFLSRACGARNRTRHSPKEKEALGADSCSLTDCESKRTIRRRKSSQLDKECESEVCEAVPVKKYTGRGRKDKETGSRQRKRLKSFESSSVIKIQAPNNNADHDHDDDVDLTVEDLIDIAKECVEMTKEKEQKQILNGEPDLNGQLPTTVSSINQSEGSLNPASDGNESSLAHKTRVSYDSTVILTGGKTATGSSGTGDPAQDMLDLFLGPLLKKPLEEKKSESMSNDMEFSCNLERKKQNDNVGEEVVSLGKKKGSLKDKVAMFLD